jgi:hypothetical protein
MNVIATLALLFGTYHPFEQDRVLPFCFHKAHHLQEQIQACNLLQRILATRAHRAHLSNGLQGRF